VRNGHRARVALWFCSSVAALSGAPSRAAPPSAASAEETFADGDPAGVEYMAKLKAFVAARGADLEKATRAAHEKNPCARGELTMSLRLLPDGAITDAWPEPGSGLPDDFLDAAAATVRRWKLPPTARAKAVRVRVPLGALPTAAPAPTLGCEAEILDRGRYNVTELVPGIEHGKWWAVCRRRAAAGHEVRPVKLRLKRFHSDAAGDDKNEMTGREVMVAGCDDPAFLFRGVGPTKEGPLVAAEVTSKPDAWDSTADIALGETRYHLRIEAKPPTKDDSPERGWTIVLDPGTGGSEPLDTGHTTLAPLLRVRWAGDLDGDGRADFVLEDHSDGVSLQLFLSAAALGGHKVRRVATTTYGS
jgi:hypothetical protein